jgi:hypothetical protein
MAPEGVRPVRERLAIQWGFFKPTPGTSPDDDPVVTYVAGSMSRLLHSQVPSGVLS